MDLHAREELFRVSCCETTLSIDEFLHLGVAMAKERSIEYTIPGTGLLVQWQAHHNRKTFGYIIDVRRVQLDVRFIEDDREKGLVALTVVARCMALYGVIEIRGVALRTVFVTQGAVPHHSFGIVFINCHMPLDEAMTV